MYNYFDLHTLMEYRFVPLFVGIVYHTLTYTYVHGFPWQTCAAKSFQISVTTSVLSYQVHGNPKIDRLHFEKWSDRISHPTCLLDRTQFESNR